MANTIVDLALLSLAANCSFYGIVGAAVVRWNFTFKRLSKLLKKAEALWSRLDRSQLFFWIFFFSTPIWAGLFIWLCLVGLLGIGFGFGHAEEAKLKLSGEKYLGQDEDNRWFFWHRVQSEFFWFDEKSFDYFSINVIETLWLDWSRQNLNLRERDCFNWESFYAFLRDDFLKKYDEAEPVRPYELEEIIEELSKRFNLAEVTFD